MIQQRKGFTLIEIMVVVLIIATLLAIAIPNFIHARETSRARTCQANLRMMVSAKEQWAMDNHKNSADTPISADLVTAYIKGTTGVLPVCPAGGSYDIGNLGTWPSCSIGANGTAGDASDDHVYVETGS